MIQALTEAGLEVVRVTRSSISIADPNGGKNIRLKGAFYEQSFTDGRGVREKAERESRIYRDNAERRVQQARKSVSKAVTSNETKIKDAIALFTTSTEESLETPGRGEEAMMQHRKDVLKLAGNTGMRLLGRAFSCLPRVAGRSGILAGGYRRT